MLVTPSDFGLDATGAADIMTTGANAAGAALAPLNDDPDDSVQQLLIP